MYGSVKLPYVVSIAFHTAKDEANHDLKICVLCDSASTFVTKQLVPYLKGHTDNNNNVIINELNQPMDDDVLLKCHILVLPPLDTESENYLAYLNYTLSLCNNLKYASESKNELKLVMHSKFCWLEDLQWLPSVKYAIECRKTLNCQQEKDKWMVKEISIPNGPNQEFGDTLETLLKNGMHILFENVIANYINYTIEVVYH